MLGMNGFHVSAIGAIQGHYGPLVSLSTLLHLRKAVSCMKKKFVLLLMLESQDTQMQVIYSYLT